MLLVPRLAAASVPVLLGWTGCSLYEKALSPERIKAHHEAGLRAR
jgi:hypothetical protein